MTDGTDTSSDWPQGLNATTGVQIRRARHAAGLKAEEVVERLAALGWDVSRAKITNLERGRIRREGLAVGEAMALGYVLGVPPVTLLFPVEDNPSVEVLPSVERSAWDAEQWFTGVSTAGLVSDAEFRRGASALTWRRGHEYWHEHYLVATSRSRALYGKAMRAEDSTDREMDMQSSKQATEQARDALRQLVWTRRAMESAGMAVPELDPNMQAQLDEMSAQLDSEGRL